MTSDETQIQILANWPMSRAKRVATDNIKKTRISCRCRDKETPDRQKTVPAAEKSWPNHHCLLVFLFLADQIYENS